MSETTKKPNRVEVVEVEVKAENFAKAKLKDLDTGETSWHGYYRKRYKPKAGEDPRTDAEIMVVPKARLYVDYQYQDGRAKNDGSGEKWPGDYNIKDVRRLDEATLQEARDILNGPVEAPGSPAQAVQPRTPSRDTLQAPLTDKDRLIGAQSARKDAAVIESALIVSMGHEEWFEKRGINAFRQLTEDCFNIAIEVAKGDPFGD